MDGELTFTFRFSNPQYNGVQTQPVNSSFLGVEEGCFVDLDQFGF